MMDRTGIRVLRRGLVALLVLATASATLIPPASAAAASVSGRVVYSTGEPAGSIAVSSSQGLSATTDEDGAFAIVQKPGATSLTLRVPQSRELGVPGMTISTSTFKVGEGRRVLGAVRLPEMQTHDLRVSDAAGNPLEGAGVQFSEPMDGLSRLSMWRDAKAPMGADLEIRTIRQSDMGYRSDETGHVSLSTLVPREGLEIWESRGGLPKHTVTYRDPNSGLTYSTVTTAATMSGGTWNLEGTRDVVVPSMPEFRAIKAGDRSGVVTWAPVDNASGYIFRYAHDHSPAKVVRLDRNVSSVKLTRLVNGRPYGLYLEAFSEAGISSINWSPVDLVPKGRPSAPARPKVKAGKKKVTITWKAPAANGARITSFVIRSSSGATRTVSATRRSFIWKGLKKGRKYSFRVVARNSVGPGTASLASSRVKVK